MNPVVSVIIPVYNVQDYIEQCLASVLNQTYRELEVIMINDGSTDNSGILAKKIADSDVRCILITQKNGGLSNARNNGLARATGKYVYFLDSDDWIENNTFEILVNSAVEKKRMLQVDYGLLSGLDSLEKDLLISPCWSWNKLYKRSFLVDNKLKFIDGLNYEDVPFTTTLSLTNPRIFYIPDYLLNYRKARACLVYTSPSPRDTRSSRMPSAA